MLVCQVKDIHIVGSRNNQTYYTVCGQIFNKYKTNLFNIDAPVRMCKTCYLHMEKYRKSMLNKHLRYSSKKSHLYMNELIDFYKLNAIGSCSAIFRNTPFKRWAKLYKYKSLVKR